MIEGLHFDLEIDELKPHLEERCLYHSSRTVWYEEQLANLKAGGIETDQAISGGNPISQMERQIEKHRLYTQRYEFMADHLIEGETYRLTERDLVNIEMFESTGY